MDQVKPEFTVLVVDDEQAFLEVLTIDFELSGCRVLTAPSGHKAFDIIQHEKVDVVLTDVRMSDGDGIELLDRIKASRPEIPVIFMTGFTDLPYSEAKERGAEAVVWKPFDLEELNRTVLGYRRQA